MKYFFMLVTLFVVGCSTVSSSLSYTKGTQALAAGNVNVAVSELERAVELDPSLARNQNNLAAAYFDAGRVLDGWPHVRKAVMMDPAQQTYRTNFRRFVLYFIHEGIVETGASEEQVVSVLGEPDGKKVREPCSYWQYAAIALCFQNGRLDGIANMQYER